MRPHSTVAPGLLPGNLSPRDRRAHTRVPRPCFLTGRRVGGIEDVFEVFLPPIHNVPSQGQQRTVFTIHSVDDALLPPPEMPDGEPLQSHLEVVLHGLTELLPCPGFCFSNRRSCAPLGLPVPACCLRSHTGQKGPIGLLLQFDGIPHCRCPSAGSGIAATAGTVHLAATAPVGRLNNGGVEHGPLGLNVPRLPRYMVKALPEVGIEALSDRRLCQTFLADHHNTLGLPGTNNSQDPSPHPKVEGGYPLVYRGELQHTGTKLGGNKYCHPCPAPLTSGNSTVEESPTPLEKTGSRALAMRRGSFPTREVTFHVPRASFCSRGLDRQGPRLRLLPSSHCTRPLWPLLLVVSLREGGPMSSLRAVPGRAPWVQARPPGARPAPRPGSRGGPR
ncbi:hypothetical protein N1851_007739 [Merluccius polli]|uniref:Uncharacterized protein n=1 Tax=Merluccius polli TaxID=89951 RepID=A0AA47N3F6_MERPO|nr:hypothetical protein N1851_007739 [Merluccius polli]